MNEPNVAVPNPDDSITITRSAFREALQATANAIVDEVFRTVVPPKPADEVARLSDEIAALNAKLDSLNLPKSPAPGVPAATILPSENVQRTAFEIHGKLRRIKKDLDSLNGVTDTNEVHEALRATVNRLLVEVFSHDPDLSV